MNLFRILREGRAAWIAVSPFNTRRIVNHFPRARHHAFVNQRAAGAQVGHDRQV